MVSVVPTSEKCDTSAMAGFNPVRLRACVKCEARPESRGPDKLPVTETKGTLINYSTPKSSPAASAESETPLPSKFSDLLKKLFINDSHGRCIVTLASGPDTECLFLRSSDITENNLQLGAGLLSTPSSCFSPLSQSVTSTGPMKGLEVALRAEIGASLYPAGASVGLLHFDATLIAQNTFQAAEIREWDAKNNVSSVRRPHDLPKGKAPIENAHDASQVRPTRQVRAEHITPMLHSVYLLNYDDRDK